MHLEIGVQGGDLAHVPGVGRQAAPAAPQRSYLVAHVAECHQRAPLDHELGAELGLQFLHAAVGDVSPRAQDVGEVLDGDGRQPGVLDTLTGRARRHTAATD